MIYASVRKQSIGSSLKLGLSVWLAIRLNVDGAILGSNANVPQFLETIIER